MTNLWKITSGTLSRVGAASLNAENELEEWIVADSSILGLDILLVGRQVQTHFGGRIDILAMDRDGGLVLIELKRDKTPREIVAQVLDYASWVVKLSTKQVHDLALHYREKPLSVLFREHFDAPLPENVNTSHSLLLWPALSTNPRSE